MTAIEATAVSPLLSGVPGMGKSAAVRRVLAIRPASPCPDHPGRVLTAFPGGAARGMCPVDGRSYQLDTPEVA